MRHLDWTVQPIKYTKPKYKKDGTYAKNGEPRPITNQRLPGFPAWYKGAWADVHEDDRLKRLLSLKHFPFRTLPHSRAVPDVGTGAIRDDTDAHHAVPAQAAMERLPAAASGRARVGLRCAKVHSGRLVA